ncbi:Yippee-like protein [Cynara cardunculus var. scolymus]|uniref:Yippee-like protein n=1 Tax=Cynara cardunculus var. scolymus TaxID=59895 RepID=A0A103XHZ2_CYNCS|nr:Yippee-like protein [Cynara cardunculus var. scolymus]
MLLSMHDDIISKAFQASHGRAFLFSHVMNVVSSIKQDRHLMTGLHNVADVHCSDCGEITLS